MAAGMASFDGVDAAEAAAASAAPPPARSGPDPRSRCLAGGLVFSGVLNVILVGLLAAAAAEYETSCSSSSDPGLHEAVERENVRTVQLLNMHFGGCVSTAQAGCEPLDALLADGFKVVTEEGTADRAQFERLLAGTHDKHHQYARQIIAEGGTVVSWYHVNDTALDTERAGCAVHELVDGKIANSYFYSADVHAAQRREALQDFWEAVDAERFGDVALLVTDDFVSQNSDGFLETYDEFVARMSQIHNSLHPDVEREYLHAGVDKMLSYFHALASDGLTYSGVSFVDFEGTKIKGLRTYTASPKELHMAADEFQESIAANDVPRLQNLLMAGYTIRTDMGYHNWEEFKQIVPTWADGMKDMQRMQCYSNGQVFSHFMTPVNPNGMLTGVFVHSVQGRKIKSSRVYTVEPASQIDTVKAFYEAFDARDADAMEPLLTSDFESHGNRGIAYKSEFLEGIRRAALRFTSPSETTRTYSIDGSRVISHWHRPDSRNGLTRTGLAELTVVNNTVARIDFFSHTLEQEAEDIQLLYEVLDGDKDISSLEPVLAPDYTAYTDSGDKNRTAFLSWWEGLAAHGYKLKRHYSAGGRMVTTHWRMLSDTNNTVLSHGSAVHVFEGNTTGGLLSHSYFYRDCETCGT